MMAPIGPPLQHASVAQAALDRARRLGLSLSPGDLPRVDRAVAAAPPARGAGGVPHGNRFDDVLRLAAAREGLETSLVRAVAQAESNLNPGAVSVAGAKGLMQLMDGTARQLGVTDPFDPTQNVLAGARYLRQLLGRFGGDLRRALAAYNAGPGAVERYGGVPPFKETQAYVQRVLALQDHYRAVGTAQ